jgi:hypothetical protein
MLLDWGPHPTTVITVFWPGKVHLLSLRPMTSAVEPDFVQGSVRKCHFASSPDHQPRAEHDDIRGDFVPGCSAKRPFRREADHKPRAEHSRHPWPVRNEL